MGSILIETVRRHTRAHRRTLALYVVLLVASMSIAASVSAIANRNAPDPSRGAGCQSDIAAKCH